LKKAPLNLYGGQYTFVLTDMYFNHWYDHFR